MAVTSLITIAESDTYNALSADWIALTDPIKEAHIFNASVYMQTKWTCADVDWSDTDTLDEDLKRACAYYADADSIGVLSAPIETTDKHGNVTEETRKLGTMLKTTKWAEGGTTSGDPLESINSIMSIYCTSNVGRLIRV